MITTATMDEAARSAWCRQQGVYPQQLQQWRDNATQALAEPEEARASPQQTRQDRHPHLAARARGAAQGPGPGRDRSTAGAVKKALGDLHQRRARIIGLEDRQALALFVANEPRFADMLPARIVPMLADEGTYLASESSFQRVLPAHGQTRHRGRAKAPGQRRPPTTHIATAPRQLWRWDMTFLPAEIAGRWFYLYLILDVFSRKVVGFEVHDRDDADHAAHLVKRTALAEGIHAMATRPVLHGDNGATLRATTVLAMLHWLGVKPWCSRPRVSDDNAFVESLFRTAKYRSEFPVRPLPISTTPARGQRASCIGTTMII